MARRHKLPTYLSPQECDRLLAAVRCPRDRVLFAVMLYAGLRVAELCDLRTELVDLVRSQLLVFCGKGERDRMLPLSGKLEPLLREWIGERTTGYLFPSPHAGKSGRPLTTRAVHHAVAVAARKAGITRPDPSQQISPHKLRHSFATNLVARGVDIVTVKDLMGHSSVSTTSIYLQPDASRLKGVVDRL